MKSKRLILACMLALGASSQAHATYLSALLGSGDANTTFEDQSREEWVDVDGDGFLGAGDKLQGILRFDSFNPPDTDANNTLYVTFEQTFGDDFSASCNANGCVYYGTFSEVSLNFYDYTGTTNWGLDGDLSGGLSAAITDVQANGTLAFSAGLVNPEDFFAFQTARLQPGLTDYVLDPSLLSEISTSQTLGSFGAGLSITLNNLPVIFNQVLGVSFSHLGDDFGIGQLYQMAVVNGNFGGICQEYNTAGECIQTIQGLPSGFINNADVVLNTTAVPEPTTLALLGLGLGLIGFRKRSRV